MDYLTVRDVAALVRRNEETIRRMIRARKLDVTLDNNNRRQGYQIPVDALTRTWAISREDVERYIDQRRAQPPERDARLPLGPERAARAPAQPRPEAGAAGGGVRRAGAEGAGVSGGGAGNAGVGEVGIRIGIDAAGGEVKCAGADNVYTDGEAAGYESAGYTESRSDTAANGRRSKYADTDNSRADGEAVGYESGDNDKPHIDAAANGSGAKHTRADNTRADGEATGYESSGYTESRIDTAAANGSAGLNKPASATTTGEIPGYAVNGDADLTHAAAESQPDTTAGHSDANAPECAHPDARTGAPTHDAGPDDELAAWCLALGDAVQRALNQGAARIAGEMRRAARELCRAAEAERHDDAHDESGGSDMGGDWNEWHDARTGEPSAPRPGTDNQGAARDAQTPDWSADIAAVSQRVNAILGDAYRQIRGAVEHAGADFDERRESARAQGAERAQSAVERARQALAQGHSAIRDAIAGAAPRANPPRAAAHAATCRRPEPEPASAPQPDTARAGAPQPDTAQASALQPDTARADAPQPDTARADAPHSGAAQAGAPWESAQPTPAPEFDQFRRRQPDFDEPAQPSAPDMLSEEANASYQLLQAARRAVEQRMRAAQAEPRPTEPRPAEPRPTEPRPTEPRLAEPHRDPAPADAGAQPDESLRRVAERWGFASAAPDADDAPRQP